MKEEILNEITRLQSEIERLEKEYDIYKYDSEASEPIKNNIDKKEKQIEDFLISVKEELRKKEEEKNSEIEELTKEAEERLERLESEYKIYEHDEQASGPIKNNINKIKSDLEEKVEKINKEYETEKNDILNNILKTGIDLEKYGLKEKEDKVKDIIDEVQQESGKFVTSILNGKNEGTTVISGMEFTDEELASFIKKHSDNIEQVDIPINLKESNEAIFVLYDAKRDAYIVKNINANKEKVVSRKKLDILDKKILAEKMGKSEEDLANIDTNLLQVLINYDQLNGTKKAEEYLEITQPGKTLEEIELKMHEYQMEINYNLKGLFDKAVDEKGNKIAKFNDEEINNLLNTANIAKKNGYATVRKGLKVTILETLRKIGSKMMLKSSSENGVLNLPKGKEDEKEEQNESENKGQEFKKELKLDLAVINRGKVNSKENNQIGIEVHTKNEDRQM